MFSPLQRKVCLQEGLLDRMTSGDNIFRLEVNLRSEFPLTGEEKNELS